MTWVTISCGASSWARLAMTSASSKRCSSLSRLYWSTNSASFCCVCSFTLASRVDFLPDGVVLLIQLDSRAVLLDEMLRLGDRAVQPPQELVAGARFQPGRFDLFSRFLQHGQRRLGVFLQHLLGVGLAMVDVGEDLPEQGLLGGGGLVERRSRLARRSGGSRRAAPRHGKQREVVLQPRRRGRVEVVAIRRRLLEELQRAVAIAGLQGRYALLEQTVAGRLPRRIAAGRRLCRLPGRRRNRLRLLSGNLHVAGGIARRIVNGRLDPRVRFADASGLNHARSIAGHRLLNILEDQSRTIFAGRKGVFRNPQGIELPAEGFRLADLSGGQGPADLPHQFHGLLPSRQRRTDRVGTGVTAVDLPGAGGIVLLSQGGNPPQEVFRLGVEGTIGHPLLDGQGGQLVGLLQLAPLQQGLGLLHEHAGVGLAIFFRGAVQAADFNKPGDGRVNPLGAVFIGCIANLLLPGLGHQIAGSPHVGHGQGQAGGSQQGVAARPIPSRDRALWGGALRGPDLGLREAGTGIAIVRRRCLQLLSASSGRKPRHAVGIRGRGRVALAPRAANGSVGGAAGWN